MLGPVLTTFLSQQGVWRDREDGREREVQDRWFEERRNLYLEVITITTEVFDASRELTEPVTPAQRHEIVEKMVEVRSRFWPASRAYSSSAATTYTSALTLRHAHG